MNYIILYCCLIPIATVFATLVDKKTGWKNHLMICILATPYYVIILTLAQLLRIKFLVSILEDCPSLIVAAFFIANIVLFFRFDSILASGYDARMHKLNYAEANGHKIVTYITNDDEYNKEYLPEELQAASSKEVGYILEITESSKSKTYRNLTKHMDEDVTMQILHLKLIDCDTNRTVASEFIDQEFPGNTTKSYISVPESIVMKWVTSVYPE